MEIEIGTSYLLRGYDSWFNGLLYLVRTHFGPDRSLKQDLDDSKLMTKIGAFQIMGMGSRAILALESIQARERIEILGQVDDPNRLEEEWKKLALDYAQTLARYFSTGFMDLTRAGDGSGESSGRSAAG